jgi:hypothetical protein
VALNVPAYDALFASFTNLVRVPTALSGEAAVDAALVLGAVRAGRVYSVVTGIARSGGVRFEAASDGRRAGMGEHLIPRGAVTVSVEADVPPEARTSLVCGGRVAAEQAGGRLTWTTEGVPGACRAEVSVPWAGTTRLWLVTNPIYVRAQLDTAPPLEMLPVVETAPLRPAVSAWAIERAPDATGAVSASASSEAAVEFSWRLGPTAQSFAAMQLATPPDLARFDSVVVHASADRPMRVWVQVRVPGGDGRRWGRSVYLDAEPRAIRVPFTAMLPLDAVGESQPPLAEVTALLMVVDTVHAVPGSAGRLTITALDLAR